MKSLARGRAYAGRIERVELARYGGPGRSLARPHGMLVRLIADAAGRPVTGIGEAVVAGDQTDAAWREVRQVTSHVVGSALPDHVDAPDPLRGIGGWRPVGAVDRGPRRAAKLAVEMALLDLLMKAGGRSPADLWSATDKAVPICWQPVHHLPTALPGSVRDDLSPALRADPGSSWAVKLGATGTPEVDLAWLRHVCEIERHAGRDRPLWLVNACLDRAAAGSFVRDLADRIARGELTSQVLLEEPVAMKPRSLLSKLQQRSVLARFQRRSRLVDLQRAADDVLSRDGSGSAGGARLSIVAGGSVVAPGQLSRLRGGGSVDVLHLSLSRFGSLLGLREAARLAKRDDPAMTVLLAGERGSRVTSAALEALAATTPEIDRYVPEPGSAAGWPSLATRQGSPQGDRRVGFVAGIELGELSETADELATLPGLTRAAVGEQPNRFPDYPMSGVALAVRSMLLETEALRAGLRTRRFARDFFLAEDRQAPQTIGFVDSESSATSAAASVSAAHKGVSRDLLARQGLPVPAGKSFRMEERDRAYAAGVDLGFPLVVKPAGGSKGTAVTTGITTAEELEQALDEVAASRYADTGVVVERFATGSDYRVLATPSEVISVVRREPASVTGDGQGSVEELVLAANVARRQNPHLAKRLISLDARVDDQLTRYGLTRDSVPDAGRLVPLRAEANLSQGGHGREVLDSTHPSVRGLAMAAVAAVPGLPYAGLDVLMDDHRLAVDSQRVTIIEINSRPVQSLHHFPMYGPPRNVSERLVRGAAEAAGMGFRPAPDELTVGLTVSGRVHGVGYQRWLAGAAKRLALDGWVGRAAEPDQVNVVVHGPAPRVGLLLRLAFHGPAGAGVVETCAEPVEAVPGTGFKVRRGAGRS